MEGFWKPNYTQIPNDLLDHWLSRLREAELKVLLYIARRTTGFQQERAEMGLTRMAHGTTDGDRQLDRGTGLSRGTVLLAVKSLEARRLITVTRDGTRRAVYELAVIEQPGLFDAPELVRNSDQLGAKATENWYEIQTKTGTKFRPGGKKERKKNKPSSSEVPVELLRELCPALAMADDDGLIRLFEACRKHAPECTPEDVGYFVHETFRRKQPKNPVGFAITAVPRLFEGPNSPYIRLRKRFTEVATEQAQRDAAAAQALETSCPKCHGVGFVVFSGDVTGTGIGLAGAIREGRAAVCECEHGAFWLSFDSVKAALAEQG